MPLYWRIKNIITDIVEYIDVEGLYAPVLGGLRILLEMTSSNNQQDAT